MTITVEFRFDFGSQNAYLSHLVIPAIEARSGVKFNYVPVLLGGVFKSTNNVSPMVAMHGPASASFSCPSAGAGSKTGGYGDSGEPPPQAPHRRPTWRNRWHPAPHS